MKFKSKLINNKKKKHQLAVGAIDNLIKIPFICFYSALKLIFVYYFIVMKSKQ